MAGNPWHVESILAFYCLKCPECEFNSKEENNFVHHAKECHPLSNVLFGEENYSDPSFNFNKEFDTDQIKQENISDLNDIDNFDDRNTAENISLSYDDVSMNENENEFKKEGPVNGDAPSKAIEKALAPSPLGQFPSYVDKVDKQRCYMCKFEGKSNHKLGFVQTQCCSCKKGVCKVHHHILCPTCDTPSTLGSIPSYVDKEHKQRCYMCKLEGKNNDKLGFVQTQCCSCKKGVCKLHHRILCQPICQPCAGNENEFKIESPVKPEKQGSKFHKQEKMYDCNMCDANFKHRKDLKNHTASEHIKPQDQEKSIVVRPFMCSTCGMNFVTKFKLTRHTNAVHEKIRPFMCNECGTSFASKRDLDMHISALHDEKIANISQLIVMKKKIKAGDAFKAHPCPHCEVRCTRKDHLTRHIKTVHERQRFDECPICQKTFCQPYRLKDHIESVHEEKKSFECPREGCDKTFSFQKSISKHIERVHEGKQPYSCDICGAGFANKLRLARHIASEKCIVLKQAPSEGAT